MAQSPQSPRVFRMTGFRDVVQPGVLEAQLHEASDASRDADGAGGGHFVGDFRCYLQVDLPAVMWFQFFAGFW